MNHPIPGDAEHQQHRAPMPSLRADQRAHRRLNIRQVDRDGGQLALNPCARSSPATERPNDGADSDRHRSHVVVGGQQRFGRGR